MLSSYKESVSYLQKIELSRVDFSHLNQLKLKNLLSGLNTYILIYIDAIGCLHCSIVKC